MLVAAHHSRGDAGALTKGTLGELSLIADVAPHALDLQTWAAETFGGSITSPSIFIIDRLAGW